MLRHRDAPAPVQRDGVGNNGGPLLDDGPDADGGWVWRRARRRAWNMPPEILLRRLARMDESRMS